MLVSGIPKVCAMASDEALVLAVDVGRSMHGDRLNEALEGAELLL